MFMRIDRLQYDLPEPKEADPVAAGAVQELLGGRFGEMSTLNNYMFQSFNFKNKEKLKPFYGLVASITAEEFGHVELVTAAINLLMNGPRKPGKQPVPDPDDAPLNYLANLPIRNPQHFLSGGQNALVGDSRGIPWNGDYVFTTGNLILDHLHNFFLECGARIHKLRVYETLKNPVGREMVGYLLVRGSLHAVAYAKSLEKLTGVEMTKFLPVPRIDTAKIPEAKKIMDNLKAHTILYRFSQKDYEDVGLIWNGTTPEGPGECVVEEGPPVGGMIHDLADIPEEFAPDYHPEEIFEIAKNLYKKSR